MPENMINIVPGERRPKIAPDILGHTVEFLDRCINDGVWVGVDPNIPQDDGLRLDIIEALRRIGAPVFRWPGDTFADCFHWQDDIGLVPNAREGATSSGVAMNRTS